MLKASSLNKIYHTSTFDPSQKPLSLKSIVNSYTLIRDHEGNILRKYDVNLA